MSPALERLSKSKVQSGAQCHLRLWYEIHDRGLATGTSDALQSIFDVGNRVGELARQRDPRGVLIDSEYWDTEGALEQTAAALEDDATPAWYEPAFMHAGVLVRVDILQRSGEGEYDLMEVKAATRSKAVYVRDAAIQRWVLAGAGVPLARAGILTLDRDYVYDGEALDLDRLFVFHDRTAEIDAMQPEIEEQIATLRSMLGRGEAPRIEPGPQCNDPYECPFLAHCTRDLPKLEHPVSNLRGIRANRLAELKKAGIAEITEIPDDYPLSDIQARIRECAISGREWVAPELHAELESIAYPLHYLDFETLAPAIPRYAGTRPYMSLPFQYSIHSEDENGAVEHTEYLHDEDSDPRRGLAMGLIADLGGSGTICVFSSFERGVIEGLAREFPDLAPDLEAIGKRLWDLLAVIRRSYYHPDFKGSYSIKAVLPAVVPKLSYEGLDIQDGMQASRMYEVALDTADPSEKDEIFRALREYCSLDTLAMVELRKALRRLSAPKS